MSANYNIFLLKSIVKQNGRYLETMIQGSKLEAEQGNLVCLSAGDKSVFDDCESVFSAISKNSFYLGIPTTYSTLLFFVLLFNNFVFTIIIMCQFSVFRGSWKSL